MSLAARKARYFYFKLFYMLNSSNPNAAGVQVHETCKVFSFDHDTNVEVVLINNEPYFVAADVCIALGLPNVTNALLPLDDDERLPLKILRAGQNRIVNVISESGLYALVIRSTKPNAKKFRKWVTSEVLPAIRKTGMYSTSSAYPGELVPTNCAVITCYTADGQTKQAYLMYGDDTWFGCPAFIGDRHNTMQSMTHRIGVWASYENLVKIFHCYYLYVILPKKHGKIIS